MQKYSYEALGTHFSISIWDQISDLHFSAIVNGAELRTREFDSAYSRFIPTSLVNELSRRTGVVSVPHDLVAMLRLYKQLHIRTNGKINPCIGFSISDIGYDAMYSFESKSTVRKTPDFNEALRVIDDTTIDLRECVLLDLGALGKGYVIDLIFNYLKSEGMQHFLIDGSGDIRYTSQNSPIQCGLENPMDTSQVIGVATLTEGALCASATNRRRWGDNVHHYIDPDTNTSPDSILATWVTAETAALADGIASALFFEAPEAMFDMHFGYAIVNKDMQLKNSAGFAEFF